MRLCEIEDNIINTKTILNIGNISEITSTKNYDNISNSQIENEIQANSSSKNNDYLNLNRDEFPILIEDPE